MNKSRSQRAVERFRNIVEPHWKTPDVKDSLLFTFQELSEFADALFRAGYESKAYIRTHPDKNDAEAMRKVRHEAGQALMMLLTTMSAVGISADEALATALLDKMNDLHDNLTDDQLQLISVIVDHIYED